MARLRVNDKDMDIDADWATENTLREIAALMRGIPSSSQQQATRIVQQVAQNNNINAGLVSSAFDDITGQISSSFDRNNSTLHDVASGFRNTAMAVTQQRDGGMMRGIFDKMFFHASESSRRLGREFDIASLKTSNLGTAILGVTIGVLTYLGKELYNQAGVYRDLYKQGLLYSRVGETSTASIGRLGNAAIAAGITMGDMTDLMKKYGRVMTRDGIENFARMSKTVAQYGSDYALTHAESAEYLAEYMEMQRASGVLYTMSNQQIIDGAKQQMQYGMQFARQLGISTEELKKNQQQNANAPDMMTAMLAIPQDIRASMGPKLQQLVAAFDAQGLKPFSSILLKFVQSGNLALNEQDIIALRTTQSGQNIVSSFQHLSDAIKSGNVNDIADVNQELIEQIGLLSDEVGGSELIMRMNQIYPGFQELANAAMLAKDALHRASMSEKQTRDEMVKNITSTSSMFNFLRGSLDLAINKLWQSEGFVSSLQDAMHNLSQYMESGEFQGVVDKVGELIIKVADKLPDLIKSIGAVADYIGGIISWFAPEKPKYDEGDERSLTEKFTTGAVALGTFVLGTKTLLAKFAADFIIETGKITTPLIRTFTDLWGLFRNASPFITKFSVTWANVKDVIKGAISGFRGLSLSFIWLEFAFAALKGVFKGITEFNSDRIWGSVLNILSRAVEGVIIKFIDSVDSIIKIFKFLGQWVAGLFPGNKSLSWSEFSKKYEEESKNGIIQNSKTAVNTMADSIKDNLVGTTTKPAEEVQTYEQTQEPQTKQELEVEKQNVDKKVDEKVKEERRKEEEQAAKNKRTDEENIALNRKIAKNSEDLVSIMDELRGLMERMNDTLVTIRNNTKAVPPPN